ncbi:hypothetical protein NP493_847g01064 [Ridgeia piscesae]|uniref:Uncharacterized protein n=1 Tax=Ridgeia piscesae TaxID=27915 RepID=A0AAD9KMC0_RIDPI|nr:hypothetical protein NP493_847g01064 [Ridgeia piscesae]
MVDTGVNKVTCTTENLVLLKKPPIATRGKGDERPTCRRENSTTTKLSPSFQPVSDTKQTTCHSNSRPFVFHRRPSKPTLISQKTPIVSTENTSLNKKSHPLVEDASLNDSKQCCSKAKPGVSEMSATNRRLFITQDIADKSSLQKPRLRPASAHVLGERKKSQTEIECFIPTIASKVENKKPRPASAHVSGNVSKVDIEPMVYGLADNRRVSGSETDLASAGQLCLYRLCTDQKKDESTTKAASPRKDISMPRRFHLLQPWLTDLSSDSPGTTPKNCLVFVPSLKIDEGTLPVVPPVQLATDQLPYKYKIVEPEPWCPKKYDHPWRQRPVSAWQCHHGAHRSAMPRLPSLMKIYSEEGQLLHMRYSGKRTANIVRKEIQELEDLLKGVGSRDGCSIVVQYQAEISHLQTMLNRTKGRVEEIER